MELLPEYVEGPSRIYDIEPIKIFYDNRPSIKKIVLFGELHVRSSCDDRNSKSWPIQDLIKYLAKNTQKVFDFYIEYVFKADVPAEDLLTHQPLVMLHKTFKNCFSGKHEECKRDYPNMRAHAIDYRGGAHIFKFKTTDAFGIFLKKKTKTMSYYELFYSLKLDKRPEVLSYSEVTPTFTPFDLLFSIESTLLNGFNKNNYKLGKRILSTAYNDINIVKFMEIFLFYPNKYFVACKKLLTQEVKDLLNELGNTIIEEVEHSMPKSHSIPFMMFIKLKTHVDSLDAIVRQKRHKSVKMIGGFLGSRASAQIQKLDDQKIEIDLFNRPSRASDLLKLFWLKNLKPNVEFIMSDWKKTFKKIKKENETVIKKKHIENLLKEHQLPTWLAGVPITKSEWMKMLAGQRVWTFEDLYRIADEAAEIGILSLNIRELLKNVMERGPGVLKNTYLNNKYKPDFTMCVSYMMDIPAIARVLLFESETAICYLGQYHAKTWNLFFEEFAKRNTCTQIAKQLDSSCIKLPDAIKEYFIEMTMTGSTKIQSPGKGNRFTEHALPRTVCVGCNASVSSNFFTCGGCFTPTYCSKECQRLHWDKTHSIECGGVF